MGRKRRHSEVATAPTTQELLDQQLGKGKAPAFSTPPLILQNFFPAEIITLIFEFYLKLYLETPVPIKLPNRHHAEAPHRKKKGDRTKYFWTEAEGLFPGILTAPSAMRDEYRAHLFHVNTFLVNRWTEYRTQNAFSNKTPIHIGSVLDAWPESYWHIRSLVIDGKGIPIDRRDAVAKACPNLTHLRIIDLGTYVLIDQGHPRSPAPSAWSWRMWCGTHQSTNRPRPHREVRLTQFTAYPKLRHIEFQVDGYWNTKTRERTDLAWHNDREAHDVCKEFAKVEREVRVECVGPRGDVYKSFFVPTEDGSFTVPEYGIWSRTN